MALHQFTYTFSDQPPASGAGGWPDHTQVELQVEAARVEDAIWAARVEVEARLRRLADQLPKSQYPVGSRAYYQVTHFGLAVQQGHVAVRG